MMIGFFVFVMLGFVFVIVFGIGGLVSFWV